MAAGAPGGPRTASAMVQSLSPLAAAAATEEENPANASGGNPMTVVVEFLKVEVCSMVELSIKALAVHDVSVPAAKARSPVVAVISATDSSAAHFMFADTAAERWISKGPETAARAGEN